MLFHLTPSSDEFVIVFQSRFKRSGFFLAEVFLLSQPWKALSQDDDSIGLYFFFAAFFFVLIIEIFNRFASSCQLAAVSNTSSICLV